MERELLTKWMFQVTLIKVNKVIHASELIFQGFHSLSCVESITRRELIVNESHNN